MLHLRGLLSFLLTVSCLRAFATCNATPAYLVGTGIADVTGPAANVNMMGYADPDQIVAGIRTRLYARAFLFADPNQPSTRFVFVVVDVAMVTQAVSQEVFRQLQEQYKGVYSADNVALSATHTHSGPGGYFQYFLYDVTSLGFVKESFDAVVNGIMQAIAAAHNSLAPGDIYMAQGDVEGASINRSPTAYESNPDAERAKYTSNVDTTMTLLKLLNAQGVARGSLNWFAVHGTNMNNTNQLINGDNKGLASQLMQQWAAGQGSSSSPDYIAAFAQSNEGDVSPNTEGAFCLDTGLPCDINTSTCGGKSELCIARGPAYPDDAASTLIIAQKQATKAQQLHNQAEEKLTGAIQYGLVYVDMSSVSVQSSQYTRQGSTCDPAMGFSFAAGTTDGPGAFDFSQGDTKGGALWNAVRDLLKEPSAKLTQCHAPKPILLATGEMTSPYAWQPTIVDISIFRIGQLVIVNVPGEFTTMAGRRLRAAVKERVAPAWGEDVKVVIAGLTNTYSSYITTYEEYQQQRYEGASTIYGPYTLDAYIQEFVALADSLVSGTPLPPGPTPPNLMSKQWSFLPGVIVDGKPLGSSFGDVVTDVASNYQVGDTVSVIFQSACPRNDRRTGDTFLSVEIQDPKSGQWSTLYTDNDWSTTFYWSRPFSISSESTAQIQWTIPSGTAPGTYRIRHFGTSKSLLGKLSPFTGTSGSFVVGGGSNAQPTKKGGRRLNY